jgi:RNA polymerase sigma-70 factor (ECF subfamily)
MTDHTKRDGAHGSSLDATSPQPCEAVVRAGAGAVAGSEPAARVARAQRGDSAAFEALLAEARPRALAVALKVLRNPDDAEDAVQEAFLKAWRNLSRFEGRSSFSTWIHRIVMNSSLDILRRQSCRPNVTSDDETNGQEERTEEPAVPTPERVVVAAEVRRLVHGAMAVLSPAHRQAVQLRELEENTYEEIAEAAAVPIGTVMSRLHHARKRLADELASVLTPDAAAALCAA